MEALIAEITDLQVPDLPEYEPDEVMVDDDRNTGVLRGARRLQPHAALRRPDVAAPLRVPAARLRRVPDVLPTSARQQLPDIPDQHIAQMVAGIDVLLFRPDAELRRLARLAIDTGVDGAFVEGRTPAEIDAELGESDAGRAWLEELERIKDPWFNMATGDGLYHYYRSWLRRPEHPVRVADRLRRAR